MTRLRFTPALALALLLSATSARADDEEARRLFDRASEALVDGRFVVARDLLRRSLAEREAAPTAFNLAVALRGTGETLEAITLFEALLADRFGPLEADRRAEVAAILRETSNDVATLHITARAPGASSIQIRVDGDPAQAPVRAGRVDERVDAGRHIVSAAAEGFDPTEQRVEVERGADADVVLTLRRRPVLAATPSTDEDPTPSLFETPWFWIATAVVVAATITAIVLATTESLADPYRDPVFGTIETLR